MQKITLHTMCYYTIFIAILGTFGFYANGFILLPLSFILFALMAKLFRKIQNPFRALMASVLIPLFIIMHISCAPFDAKFSIYLYGQDEPFVGDNQSFIIVFGVEGAATLIENGYAITDIHIPEDGILLTSTSVNDYDEVGQ